MEREGGGGRKGKRGREEVVHTLCTKIQVVHTQAEGERRQGRRYTREGTGSTEPRENLGGSIHRDHLSGTLQSAAKGAKERFTESQTVNDLVSR